MKKTVIWYRMPRLRYDAGALTRPPWYRSLVQRGLVQKTGPDDRPEPFETKRVSGRRRGGRVVDCAALEMP
jgi:hypothetical protein